MSDGASLHIFRPNLSSKISSKSPLPKEANGSHKMPPFVKKEIAGGGGGGGGLRQLHIQHPDNASVKGTT